MTTYCSEKFSPRMATSEEQNIICTILKNKDQIKNLVEENQKLLESLKPVDPMVTKDVCPELEATGYRTYIVDVPKGHYVVYRPLDLAMDAKTTKEDMKELNLS